MQEAKFAFITNEVGSGFPLLVIPGGGHLEPIATNGTDAGCALNRRVAVKSLTAEAETRR
jgi:outer membrane protein OmpA-like peptidoglycan-associated protein